LENNVYAGGRVMVITFAGRTKNVVKSPQTGVELQAGEQFSGYLALAYDAPNNRYIQLYADDLGKVTLNTTEKWEAQGETLRLHFSDAQTGNYMAELAADGPAKFSYKVYGAHGAAEGAQVIKSANLRRL